MNPSDPGNAMIPYREAIRRAAIGTVGGQALAHGMFSPLDALPALVHAAVIRFMDEAGLAPNPGDLPSPPQSLTQALEDTP